VSPDHLTAASADALVRNSEEQVSPPRRKSPPSHLRRRLNHWVHGVKWFALRQFNRWDLATVRRKLDCEPFAQILNRYPDMPLKIVRPYLTRGLRRRHRVAALLGHYDAASRLLSDTALIESHTDGLELYVATTAAGSVSVKLTGQGGLHREGEWRLVFCLDERPISQMGVAIVERSLLRIKGIGNILLIGALKAASPAGEGLRDARILTSAMEGMRPKTLLLLVAQAMAKSLGLSGLAAVSNAGHVFAADYSLRRRISADYDGFWKESGGYRINPMIFALPMAKAQRDPAEYKPNKRSQVRRRQCLEDQITQTVRTAVMSLRRK